MDDDNRLELAALIRGLRAEIAQAWQEGQSSEIGFEAGPAEIEVTVHAEKSATAKGGVKFWVVTADAGGSLARGTTQRVKLSLTPRDRGNPSRPLYIAGEAVGDED
jgi:hypothetical protein